MDGVCKTSPCDDLCTTPEIMTNPDWDGFRVEPIGTNARCLAIEGYKPTGTKKERIVCWNLDTSARPLKVNGQPAACMQGDGVTLQPNSLGWYCVQVSAGPYTNNPGLLLPTVD
jgi:hypothetical protein